jgi:hypothetical protein
MARTGWARALVVVLVATALGVVPGTGASASGTTEATDIEIVAPLAESTVRGNVTIVAEVQLPATERGRVRLWFDVLSGTDATADPIVVEPGSCEPTCLVEATIATSTTFRSLHPSSATIRAELVTSTTSRNDSVSVAVGSVGPTPRMSLRLGDFTSDQLDGYRYVDRDQELVLSLPPTAQPEAIRVEVSRPGLYPTVVSTKDLAVQAVADGGYEAVVPVGSTGEIGPGLWSIRTAGVYDGNLSTTNYVTLEVGETRETTWTRQFDDLVKGLDRPDVSWEVDGLDREHAESLRAWWSVDGGPYTELYQAPVTLVAGTTNRSTAMTQPPIPTTAGVRTFRWQLFDPEGMPWGTAFEVTQEVTQFNAAVSAPPLVVGRPASVKVTATAPLDDPLDSCRFGLVLNGQVMTTEYCEGRTPATTVTSTQVVTPQKAGTTSWYNWLSDSSHSATIQQPVTVHAYRTVSVAAPDLTYGSKGAVKVVLRDLKVVGGVKSPAAGVIVTLQRQRIDSSTWVTYGQYRTGTDGSVHVPFTALSDARWRAVASSPYGKITSATDVSRSRARVTWTSAPTSARSGASITFKATVAPYQAGSTVQLQARRPGGGWSGKGTVAVPPSGAVQITVTAPSRGTWEYRLYRPARTIHSAGASSVRTVSVS